MIIRTFRDSDALSSEMAAIILAAVQCNPEIVLCLAAGDTPRGTYAQLVRLASGEKTDFSACTFIGLDEWVGIPASNEGSCQYFLYRNLFGPLAIRQSQIHMFNGMATDLIQECRRMDNIIRQKDGIDLALVGVGMNGHIGFNEPGVSQDLFSHVVDLDATTRTVGQKYFKEPTEIGKGITLGFGHILAARKVFMIASGSRKAKVMKAALDGPVTTGVPASLLRQHPAATTLLDEEAATLIENKSTDPKTPVRNGQ